ncbi:MAG TPA: YchJ family protein [Polyangiales bacterium]
MSIPYEDEDKLKAYCAPFLEGSALPKTAAELMASRYVAYGQGNVDYILATHDPDSRADTDREATEQWAKSARFHGLTIVNTVAGGADDDTGEVEFIARYTTDGREVAHHERSTFRKVDGRWFFSDGKQLQAPVRRAEPKLGRNDPCSCGSGKKFKKCHGQRP